MRPLCWLLFGLGHLVSLTLNWPGFHRLYPVYNWLMCKSHAVQERYGFKGPWSKVTSTEGIVTSTPGDLK